MQNDHQHTIKMFSAYLKFKGYNVTAFDKKVFFEFLDAENTQPTDIELDEEYSNAVKID